jgi:spore germination protein KC
VEAWIEWWERSLKRWFLFTMICVLSLLAGGCWDRLEVNDMALVLATGVDATPQQKYKVSIQLALPTGGGESQAQTSSTGKNSYFVEDETGVDITDTTSKIQEKLSRRVFPAHRRILIIGEQLAKQGIQPILDGFIRQPESRLRAYVLVAKGGTAEKILKAPYPIEKVPTEGIREILHSEIGLAVDLKNLLMDKAANQSIVLPTIELVGDGKTTKKIFQINGAAVFHHDKLAGYLNDVKTRGLVLLRKEPLRSELTVYIPALKGNMSADMLKTPINVKAKKVRGQIVMYINSVAQLGITENQTKLDFTEPKTVKAIEHLFAEDLEKRLKMSLDEVQKKYKSDVVGFGEVIHRTYPQDWKRMKKNWDQEFPNLKIVWETSAKIKRTGMTSQPINVPENQIKKNIP